MDQAVSPELKQILQLLEKPFPEIRDAIAYFVAADGWAETFITHVDVENILNRLAISQEVEGRLLYLLLSALCSSDVLDEARLQRIANNHNFISFLLEFYGFDEGLGLIRLVFHAAGSTSIIFKAVTKKHGQCAIKIIQAPYLNIDAIKKATASYAHDHGVYTQYSPKIFDASSAFLIMEFIEGSTLSEYMEKLKKEKNIFSGEYIEGIASIFELLCRSLQYYQAKMPAITHGDLTPNNIIVEDSAGRNSINIKLIDFGSNYLIKNKGGEGKSFRRVYSNLELCIAPEVVSGLQPPTVKSDLYSLGIIMLELLSSGRLKREDIGTRLRLLWESPLGRGMAEIIEDLLEEDPQSRALVLGAGGNELPYEKLSSAVLNNVRIFLEGHKQQSGSVLKRARSMMQPDVVNAFHAARNVIKNVSAGFYNISELQMRCLELNIAFPVIILISCLLMTYVDVNKSTGFSISSLLPPENIEMVLRYIPHNFVVGDIWGNLPGRIVSLTFGLVASRYYANIFSLISARSSSSNNLSAVEWSIRFNSISYFFPIMVAIVYDPKLWPECAFVGSVVPAVNNYICWRRAKKAAVLGASRLSTETFHYAETERFLRMYGEWAVLMGGYSLGILVTGLLLQYHYLSDEIMYALLISAINMLKIYRVNCDSESGFVAGNLARLFYTYRRTALKDQQVVRT